MELRYRFWDCKAKKRIPCLQNATVAGCGPMESQEYGLTNKDATNREGTLRWVSPWWWQCPEKLIELFDVPAQERLVPCVRLQYLVFGCPKILSICEPEVVTFHEETP